VNATPLRAEGSFGPTLTLAPAADNVQLARHYVMRGCTEGGVSGDVCDTAVLLTSEVVTNAFLHGRSEARLSMRVDAQRVEVRVGDDNSRHPVPASLDDDALDGRGLAIIDLVAQAWGVRDDDYGKTVWFSLDRG
jgi:anti-sigma regulatory factor (Ser/Thr protein kinase)